MRARIIYAHNNLNLDKISYEDLILPQYKGRVCTRSGFHPYNISLFSALIAHHGEDWFEDYIVKLKANLARKPQGNDRDQVKAIYAGVCDLSIGNHYYYFKMMNDPSQKIWLDEVSLIFPNQDTYGSHVNISGIAILNNKNYDSALDFLEFLLSDEAQKIYADDNNEFPVNPKVSPSAKVTKLLNNAKFDSIDLQEIASNRRAVMDILRKINFDG
jgi:iron(III) transport system substrate-binding protein